ncbi:unnamed protein product [marine sediment metagenome]|uniref:Dihydrodipicolinate reductase N-terminal domain-containing protein n=1 Tax=marine sediment metagenome TaxID=412755 RepID=X1KY28_9ZZZZ
MREEIKVVHVGLGPLGSRIARHILNERTGIGYVGAIDILPEIVGKDLGEVIGAGRRSIQQSADSWNIRCQSR